MGRSRIAPWIGAVVCSALVSTSAQAGGIFGVFSHRNAGCDRPVEPVCQQQCPPQNSTPKKKKTCCLCPPEPPVAPVGTSVAADPQAQLADTSAQDEQLKRLERDLTALATVVNQLVQQQGKATSASQQRIIDPAPPAPAPAAATVNRIPAIQQVSLPVPSTATGR